MSRLLALLLLALPAAALDLTWPTGLLRLDDEGRVTALLDRASGRDVAVPGVPFCRVQTEAGWLAPEAVAQTGDDVTFRFAGGVALHYRLTPGADWLRGELTAIDGEGLRAIRLADLLVDGLPTLAGVANLAYDETLGVGLLATHPNVKAVARGGHQRGGNSAGVTHTFAPVTDDAPEGQVAARYAATSTRPTGDGWSMRARSLSPALDLRGLRAIRARVRGDGGGQQLKIQLNDGQGGFRDDYIAINFTGWQEVVCDTPQLNTINLSRVGTLAFYYNGLPANRAIQVDIDDVRAELADGRIVPLETFEDPNSDLWDRPGHQLRLETFDPYGLTPAGFALVCAPRARLTEALAACEVACGLPSPRPGGEWGKTSLASQRSYLFMTNVGEADVPQVIAWAKRGGFATILLGHGSWAASGGHYAINPTFYPDGLDSLKRAVAAYHAAGLRVGLHYLAASVYPHDAYLTPQPDDRLIVDATAELAAAVEATAEVIPLRTAPDDFPAEDGGYQGSGTVVRIGDELIRYSGRQLEPPYALTGCRRGYHNTVAASHPAGAPARHLVRSYGYFLFDLDSSLAAEVAGNVARTVDAVGADMVYWDGSERLQGEHWYYNAKLQDLYYRTFANPDLLAQGSSYSHWSWHIVSRTASADGHGDVKGYLDERIPRFSWYRDNLMPLDCGWYYVYAPEVTVDQYDYILQKCLAYDASISVQTNPQRLADHPEMGPIMDLVSLYERLRLSGQVDPGIREKLAEVGREYRTLQNPLRLQRTVFDGWQTVAMGGDGQLTLRPNADDEPAVHEPARPAADGTLALDITPRLPGASLGLQVRVGELARPGAAWASPAARTLEDFTTLAPYLGQADNPAETLVTGTDKAGSTSAGVTQHWSLEPEGFQGAPCAVFTATSTRPDVAGWAAFGKTFAEPLDLSAHPGVGFWFNGDGQGGSFKVQLRNADGATDWYVANAIPGWRYVQLTPENHRSSQPADPARITTLIFYYNALPAESTITCRIAGLRALPSVDHPQLVNPSLTVGDETVTFATTLTQGDRLVWFAGEAPTVITPGHDRRTLPTMATLPAGPATLNPGPDSNANFSLRVVQDNDEILPLPEAARETPLRGW